VGLKRSNRELADRVQNVVGGDDGRDVDGVLLVPARAGGGVIGRENDGHTHARALSSTIIMVGELHRLLPPLGWE